MLKQVQPRWVWVPETTRDYPNRISPSAVANLLRYLRSGGAPCKERVCKVLLRVLPHATLRDVDFDWARFGSLEAIVEWHEESRECRRPGPRRASPLRAQRLFASPPLPMQWRRESASSNWTSLRLEALEIALEVLLLCGAG